MELLAGIAPTLQVAQAPQTKIELEWTEEAERGIYLLLALKQTHPNRGSEIRRNSNHLVGNEKESVWKSHPAD